MCGHRGKIIVEKLRFSGLENRCSKPGDTILTVCSDTSILKSILLPIDVDCSLLNRNFSFKLSLLSFLTPEIRIFSSSEPLIFLEPDVAVETR